MTDEIPLRVENLAMRYRRGLFKRGHQALDGVSLSVERGQVFGLLGPNGAGKTTMVKILLGLAVGWTGTAELFGTKAGKAVSRTRVGYLPEAHRLPNYLTGRQVLLMFGMMCGRDKAWVKARIDGWLERVDMLDNADRKLREYSKGMTQRVGLASALIHEPEIVFLDEPTDGVDPVGRAAIRDVIAGLKQTGTTIFLNSHLLLEVERMCDQVVIMDKGKLLKRGTLEELTPSTGAVRFELAAPAEGLEHLLPGTARLLRHDGANFEIAGDQAAVDAAIDRLRSRGHSIKNLSSRRMDLEEAFIDLVTQNEAAAKEGVTA
ncbi:MAG: ABC transporter ATP-binding protein [Planctomycetota bacterium]